MNNSDIMSFTAMQDKHAKAIADEMAPFEERDRAVVDVRRAWILDIERRLLELRREQMVGAGSRINV